MNNSRNRKPSIQTIKVLCSLIEEPDIWRYGYELCQKTGLKAGSIYPILIRLADREYLETSWENEPPAGRPPRHMYRLTGQGLKYAAEYTKSPQISTKKSRLQLYMEES